MSAKVCSPAAPPPPAMPEVQQQEKKNHVGQYTTLIALVKSICGIHSDNEIPWNTLSPYLKRQERLEIQAQSLDRATLESLSLLKIDTLVLRRCKLPGDMSNFGILQAAGARLLRIYEP